MATVTLPDDLAERLEPFGRWLPAVLEVSLLELRTPAHEAALELLAFLKTDPSAHDVLAYRLPLHLQTRVTSLLERNREGVLSETEQRELDEFMELEHVVRMIKLRLNEDELTGV